MYRNRWHPVFYMLMQRRQSVALLVKKSQPTLIITPIEPNSAVVTATSALQLQLMELYRDPERLLVVPRRRFEELIAEIFDGFGYIVELTAQTRDGGRDIIAIGNKDQVRSKYLIECKRPDPGQPIGVGFVRQLLGVVEDEKATKGILVATTHFTPDARALEQRNEWRLELKEYNHILDWIGDYLRGRGLG